MFKKIKCFFGFHRWWSTTPSERKCLDCEKSQAYVMYPWSGSKTYWETKKNPYL